MAPAHAERFEKPRKRQLFSDIQLGLIAGLNAGFGQVTGGQSGNTQTGFTRNSFAISLTAEKRLTRTFYLCPELGYVQRGVSTSLYEEGIDAVGDIRLNYLEVGLPIKAKFSLGSPRWRAFFLMGPTISVATTREVQVWGLLSLDMSNRFTDVDASITLGTGLEYSVSSNFGWVWHLRSHIGLVDIDKSDARFYTRDIQMLLGAQFRF